MTFFILTIFLFRFVHRRRLMVNNWYTLFDVLKENNVCLTKGINITSENGHFDVVKYHAPKTDKR